MEGSNPAPRLVIAAPQGRSGKTTISLGICAALAGRGIAVQPFKKGPDYIDPSWLSEAAGRPCRSLDPFFMHAAGSLKGAFLKGAAQAGLSLIEGNHGLYDSSLTLGPEEDGSGSTAALARLLEAPVLLVVNASRMARSAAAMVHGYQTFEPETPLAGVVLNNVSHRRHEAKLRQAIEASCGIPVLGSIPRDEGLAIPDRHLGLVPRAEDEDLVPALAACRQAAEKYLDLDAILELAGSAPPLKKERGNGQPVLGDEPPHTAGPRARIGVIRDRAFSFYYPENLEALEEAGAELIFVNSFSDPSLPAVDALYIGGGFPEMFLAELAANRALRACVRRAVEAGLPVYAECGGLMYLAERIRWGDRSGEMCGVLPLSIEMSDRPQGHGYVLARTDVTNPFFPQGFELRGHEFHHSRLAVLDPQLPTAYHLERGKGIGGGRDGLVYKNVLASYTHLHTAGSPAWAPALVRRARG